MKKILTFFGCLLQDDCKFSIKKFLVLVFTALILGLAIFTDKDTYEFLFFIAALIGVRSYERTERMRMNKPPKIEGGVI